MWERTIFKPGNSHYNSKLNDSLKVAEQNTKYFSLHWESEVLEEGGRGPTWTWQRSHSASAELMGCGTAKGNSRLCLKPSKEMLQKPVMPCYALQRHIRRPLPLLPICFSNRLAVTTYLSETSKMKAFPGEKSRNKRVGLRTWAVLKLSRSRKIY